MTLPMGIKKEYEQAAIRVDDPFKFIEELKQKLFSPPSGIGTPPFHD